MIKKILLEETPPKMSGELHIPMVLFIISAALAIGAVLMNLILTAP